MAAVDHPSETGAGTPTGARSLRATVKQSDRAVSKPRRRPSALGKRGRVAEQTPGASPPPRPEGRPGWKGQVGRPGRHRLRVMEERPGSRFGGRGSGTRFRRTTACPMPRRRGQHRPPRDERDPLGGPRRLAVPGGTDHWGVNSPVWASPRPAARHCPVRRYAVVLPEDPRRHQQQHRAASTVRGERERPAGRTRDLRLPARAEAAVGDPPRCRRATATCFVTPPSVVADRWTLCQRALASPWRQRRGRGVPAPWARWPPARGRIRLRSAAAWAMAYSPCGARRAGGPARSLPPRSSTTPLPPACTPADRQLHASGTPAPDPDTGSVPREAVSGTMDRPPLRATRTERQRSGPCGSTVNHRACSGRALWATLHDDEVLRWIVPGCQHLVPLDRAVRRDAGGPDGPLADTTGMLLDRGRAARCRAAGPGRRARPVRRADPGPGRPSRADRVRARPSWATTPTPRSAASSRVWAGRP